jgi:hypothetical protein
LDDKNAMETTPEPADAFDPHREKPNTYLAPVKKTAESA